MTRMPGRLIRRLGARARQADPPEPPDTGVATVSAAGVTLSRGGKTVLDSVDLDVRTGEVLVLVGPNGAGKSTLLSVLAGSLPPSAGSIGLCGRSLDSWRPVDAARRRAVLPQQHLVGFGFTVAEVVAMGRAPWARTDRAGADQEVIEQELERCDVATFRDRPFTTLSGGEQARVALARVLAQDTATIMLDEPTAALDLRHQETVMRIVTDRARQGAAVVVVLHDLGLAAAYADRVAVLAQGRIVADGPPVEVFTDALLSRVYAQKVEVLPHPGGGRPLVVPYRGPHHADHHGAESEGGTAESAGAESAGSGQRDQSAVAPANCAEYSRA